MSPNLFRKPLATALALAFAFGTPAATGAGKPVRAAPVPAPAALPAPPTRCIDEETFDKAGGETQPPVQAAAPRQLLGDLVGDALRRSQALGAAQLLAEAAQSDIEEAKAAKGLQASLAFSAGPAATHTPGYTEKAALQARGSLTASQLLYDGGRTDAMVDWRSALAESARLGQLNQQEQVAVNTVALALERSRWRMQVQVWAQYARKMGCLADALEIIVKSDRGRASELVLARKSLQQAELSMTQAQSQLRQTEVRLSRFVGDSLHGTQGLASVLLQVPDLAQVQADAENSFEIAQLGAQATAAERYAAAVAAGNKPQLSWTLSGAKTTATGGNVAPNSAAKSTSVGIGLALTMPLLSPGIAATSESARKRAQAAALQRADALESRRYRVAEVHEQTNSAFDRARRVAATLKDSEQVRNFTLQQWQQLGRRSLFDVMSAESEHYNLRIGYVNAIHDGEQLNAVLLSLGRGVTEWLR